MENNCASGEGLSYEDKLHVVCSVMGISSTVLLQRVVDRYYSMLVRHAGTFEDAVPSVAGEKNSVTPEAINSSAASDAEQLPANLVSNTPPTSEADTPTPTSTVTSASPDSIVGTPVSIVPASASPAAKEKRTRRWSSLPTEELDRMIIAALQQKKGACSLKDLTLSTGYTSTSRLLKRAYVLEKQGMLEVVKEGRGYLIDIANRQLQ